VEFAGAAAGIGKKQASYDRRKLLEQVGGPTALFRERAAALLVAGKIAAGNRIEAEGYAKVFFVRLAGGPEGLAAIKAACPTPERRAALAKQKQKDGDVAITNVLLFDSHAHII